MENVEKLKEYKETIIKSLNELSIEIDNLKLENNIPLEQKIVDGELGEKLRDLKREYKQKARTLKSINDKINNH